MVAARAMNVQFAKTDGASMPCINAKPVSVLVVACLMLTGCGRGGSGSPSTSPANVSAPDATGAAADAPAITLDQGPDVCFKAAAKKLGPQTKINAINALFSPGPDIDSDHGEPKGQLTYCKVLYQDPANPKRLVSMSINERTGAFATPVPVEITISGGDAKTFRLDDHLIPIGQVNATGLSTFIDQQKQPMAAVFSKYAWTGVRLTPPDYSSDKFLIRLDVTGRLAANDVKESGYAELATDGKTVVNNRLQP